MNKEDSFYMDTLEKTQPETFDFINHLSEQCHSELSFASHEINNQLSFIRSSYQLISKICSCKIKSYGISLFTT